MLPIGHCDRLLERPPPARMKRPTLGWELRSL
jgi:hypothetical protein